MSKSWLGPVLGTLLGLKTWLGPVLVSSYGPAALYTSLINAPDSNHDYIVEIML